LWNLNQQRNRPTKAEASNFPLEVLYLRNSDIPQYLIDGVVDIAIVGIIYWLKKEKFK
jgi:ATP phosphoribosyltransferase